MSITRLKPRRPMSDVTKILAVLTELARSQDEIFEQIEILTGHIEKALDAATKSANASLEVTQERIDLVKRVATLEHQIALLKEAS